ncbi:MAG: YciI family protein [Polyangiaceae bacterium]
MKFMVIVPASKESETGSFSDAKAFAEMDRFNEELVNAGVMLAGEGLHPTSKGSRLTFSGGGKTAVVDGPFTESKELIAGFWILRAKSKDEVIAWMKRAPFGAGVTLEIRQLHESDDFARVDPTGELRAKEVVLRERMSENSKRK